MSAPPAAPPKFWALRLGFFRNKSIQCVFEVDGLYLTTPPASKVDTIPYAAIGSAVSDTPNTLRLTAQKRSLKLQFSNPEAVSAFLTALNRCGSFA